LTMKGVVAGVLQLVFDASVLRGESGGERAALQTLREVRGRNDERRGRRLSSRAIPFRRHALANGWS